MILPATPPSIPNLHACTHVGTHPDWEPMWQYPVKITNIQVDITFITPIGKLIDEVNHMPKELNGLSDWVLSHWFPMWKSSHAGVGSEGGMGGIGPNQT